MYDGATRERRLRALLAVLASSALAYLLLLGAIALGLAQLIRLDAVAVALWLGAEVALCVGLVAALRWGAARRIRSPWLLLGVAPPAAYELWLLWPQVAG